MEVTDLETVLTTHDRTQQTTSQQALATAGKIADLAKRMARRLFA